MSLLILDDVVIKSILIILFFMFTLVVSVSKYIDLHIFNFKMSTTKRQLGEQAVVRSENRAA